jgi:hypothetical protein
MSITPFLRRALLPALLALSGASLVACGGGGSSAAGTSTPSGTVNVAVTDGPGDDYSHVWVTIKAIAFHTDPNVEWSASDASWQTITLAAPQTIDLTQLNNGGLNHLFQNMNLPAGSYHQIRFFIVAPEADLTASAQAQSSSSGPLQWNDQVEYQLGASTLEAPLEIAFPGRGIVLNGSFTVSAGSTLNLAVDFDLEHSVVPFRHNSLRYFALKPVLHYYDLNKSGAITGKLDPSTFCTTAITATCTYNFIVKAELLNADGSRHYVEHATTVHGDGSFSLYPLAVSDASGNPLSYDVLIRGRQMTTKLITGVPVSAGTTPLSNPTLLQASGNIALSASSAEYTAQFASPLAPLSSGDVLFQQTLPGSGAVPYEVRWGLTDPFTGKLLSPMPLENGDIEVAAYNAGNTLSFSSVTPTEGSGDYSVSVNEALVKYFTRSANVQLNAVATGSSTTFTPGTPTLDSGVSSGTVSGTITVANSASYDRAVLVIAHLGSIATTVDISSQLGNASIPFSISGLPAGSTASPQPGAYYYAYLRLWKSSDVIAKKTVAIPYLGVIDLRTTDTATFNLTLL